MKRWIHLIFLLFAATYHFDSRGSTVALTDDNGNITDRIEYSIYGLITCRAGQTDTPFLFNGRYGVMTDPNGLIYMRARYHNPYLCRFLDADPAGFSGGLNLYAYANGNPVSYVDPSGLGAVGGVLPNWLTPPSAGVDMSQVYAWLGGGGSLPYSVSFPFGDVASVLLPGYNSFGTANAALMAGDYRTAASYGVLGVAEVGVVIGSMGGSEGLSMELNAAKEIPASTPVSRLGSPMTVQPGANSPAAINGIDYTGHALDQMQSRGLTPTVIEDTLSRGVQTPGYDAATIYTTDQGRVIVNPNGSIKTVYPQSH